MTLDLGRINQLKESIDSLFVIRKAVHIIESETGINFFKDPEKAINKAHSRLEELKHS